MPTTYPGDPAATELPSPPPGPGIIPEVVLPDDDDDLNADSVRQGFKVLADFIAWIMTLFFQSVSAGATDAITQWKTANGATRCGFDHLGFPTPFNGHIQENWPGADNDIRVTTTSTNIMYFNNPWHYDVNSTSGDALLKNTTSGEFGMQVIYLEGGSSSPDYVRIDCGPAFPYKVGTYAVFNCVSTLVNYVGAATHCTQVAGFVDAAGPASVGAYFIKGTGDANWICRVKGVGGTTDVNSGHVAVDGVGRLLRVELFGASSEYGAMAKFYVDGALCATITTHLPGLGTHIRMGLSSDATGGALAAVMVVGGPTMDWAYFQSSPGI